jgi:CRP/FNR family cyclic AMP-dependent transcriptional regulator
MLDRFQGQDGRRRFTETLARQTVVNGNSVLADQLMEAAELLSFAPGELLIQAGDARSDVFFILAGRVSIEINGLEVAVRAAGTHVGEMAALDPAAPRSANVRAIDTTAVARISEADLVTAANQHPDLWRRFAIELGVRLRERSRFIRIPNDRPRIFIGSSVEMLPAARAIQAGLAYDNVSVVVWTDGVFRASRDAVTNLLEVAERTDFATLLLGADDVLVSRGNEQSVPRDNVVFELGLFIGAVGRERTFIVKPRGV